MINLFEVWNRAGMELVTPGSAVRLESIGRHVSNCVMRPVNLKEYTHLVFTAINKLQQSFGRLKVEICLISAIISYYYITKLKD